MWTARMAWQQPDIPEQCFHFKLLVQFPSAVRVRDLDTAMFRYRKYIIVFGVKYFLAVGLKLNYRL
jgi:hypothetical protein